MKYKVLVVDDNTQFANTLTQGIRSSGFDVRSVANADDAILETKQWHPHIVLLDLVMPVKDGVQFLKELSKDKVIASTPVIMISESNDPKTIDMALTLGVRDYVSKQNLDMDEIVQKINLQVGSVEVGLNNFDSAQVAEAGTLAGYKILWVEDDTYLSDIISRKLVSEDCKFTHAATGEEALEFATKETPDIVLLDILLPGISGFEVLEKMRKDPNLKNVPVIMTSNLGQKEDMDKAAGLGAQKFLVKATVTLDEIIAETKKVLLQSKGPVTV